MKHFKMCNNLILRWEDLVTFLWIPAHFTSTFLTLHHFVEVSLCYVLQNVREMFAQNKHM